MEWRPARPYICINPTYAGLNLKTCLERDFMTPITFNGCFGWLHDAAADCGVVMCSPVGGEQLLAHRRWRFFADQLASAGIPTLRFDYRGTGDSLDGGSDEQVRAWLDSICFAVDWMRTYRRTNKIALVGLRLGGLLAYAAAHKLQDISALVLIASFTSGRSYSRELQVSAHIDSVVGGLNVNKNPSRVQKGHIEYGGFVYSQKTLSELSKLDFKTTNESVFSHALFMHRGGEDELRNRGAIEHLRMLGIEVCEGSIVYEGEKYAGCTADYVNNWLVRRLAPSETNSCGPLCKAQLVGDDYEEVPIEIEAQRKLSGVFCEPALHNPRKPTLLFLTSWPISRVGHGRMWVTMARELAGLGFPSLRLDVAGVGESAEEQPGVDLANCPESAVTDVQVALKWLRTHGSNRFILISFCWGTALARAVSSSERDIDTQILIYFPLPIVTMQSELEIAGRQFAQLRNLLGGCLWTRNITGALTDSWRSAAKVIAHSWRAGIRGFHEEIWPGSVYRAIHKVLMMKVEAFYIYSAADRGGSQLRAMSRQGDVSKVRIAVLENVAPGDRLFIESHRQQLTSLIRGYLIESFGDVAMSDRTHPKVN